MSKKVRNLELSGHVGFDSLPDQLVNKAVQKGFDFNILCIGETGIGKSTLMDSLFNTQFESTPTPHNKLTSVQLQSNTYELHESNVQMKLTIVDTLGYGDQINKEESFESIVDYVDLQFEAYLQEELKTKRCLPMYHDSRIHACLYFICPTGHGLKSIDIECMKKLQDKLNIIPVIAKADTLSRNEVQQFKEKILSELDANGVKIYEFPTDDESVAEINKSMNFSVPFAVVGSSDYVRVGTKLVRARQYPWGVVQVENETHCDFVKLRDMLIRTNMEDLREVTHLKHYELYRKARLVEMGFSDVDSNEIKPMSFQQTCERTILLHQEELVKKEDQMKQHFIQRVKEKESQLNEMERELHAKFEKMKEENAKENKILEDEQNQLELEIASFKRIKAEHLTAKISPSHKTLSLGRLATLGKGKKK